MILWGAVVRATGSGAGCGAHWPLCHGRILVTTTDTTTVIEWIHRMMSGMLIVNILIATVLAFRYFSPHSTLRPWSLAVLMFTLFEAVIGAVLVLFELTGENISVLRGYVMGAHLINTFFLVACQWIQLNAVAKGPLTITALIRALRTYPWLSVGALGILVVSATGAMVALGDTLFPSSSLAEGFWQTHQPHAHLLVKLRTFHPLIALAVSLSLIIHAKNHIVAHYKTPTPPRSSARMGIWLMILVICQLLMGVFNWLLLVPLWTQLLHLGLALMVWIAVISSIIALARAHPAIS